MRVFIYDGREFPDPDPNMTPEQVRQNLSSLLPELANANTTQSKRGEDDVYKFERRVGTKG